MRDRSARGIVARARLRLAAAAVVALTVGSACTPARPVERNLVLITLDTTRADRLGCYGSTTVQTPNLDRIASRGTVFDHAFAVAPITAPSHASILSGTFPPFHQVRDNDLVAVPDGVPWLPEVLKEHGYTTAAMIAAFPLRSAMGFARGFDYFGDQLEAPPGSFVITNLHTVGVASRPGERISEEFGLWLDLAARRGAVLRLAALLRPALAVGARQGLRRALPRPALRRRGRLHGRLHRHGAARARRRRAVGHDRSGGGSRPRRGARWTTAS